MELKNVQERVKVLLQACPDCRSDDFVLVGRYYHDFCNVPVGATFLGVMMNHKQYGVPAFDTIRRTRQKLQEKYPSLKADADTQKARYEQEVKVYDYVKGRA